MATTTANQKHVLLFCALLAWPLAAAPDQTQQPIDSDAAAPDSSWSLRARLGKFERQSSTRDDNLESRGEEPDDLRVMIGVTLSF